MWVAVIRWRNVVFALIASGWGHGLAASILFTFGANDVAGFCSAVAIVSALALVPTAIAANEQGKSYELQRALDAEAEVRKLRAELVDKGGP